VRVTADEVLACVRKFGPVSGRRVAAEVAANRQDVSKALRALERAGAVTRARLGWKCCGQSEAAAPGGSRFAAPTRPKRPRPSRYVGDRVLDQIIAREIDPYEWAAAERKRRRAG
jgi:hypothetical protein